MYALAVISPWLYVVGKISSAPCRSGRHPAGSSGAFSQWLPGERSTNLAWNGAAEAGSKILSQTGPAVIIARAAHAMNATRGPEDGLYEPEIAAVGSVDRSSGSVSMNPM